jgi:hypothetical protein
MLINQHGIPVRVDNLEAAGLEVVSSASVSTLNPSFSVAGVYYL